MKRKSLNKLLYFILHPASVLVGYVCIFGLSYRVAIGMKIKSISDFFLLLVTLTYTLYYPPIVSCLLGEILSNREQYPLRNIYIAVAIETLVLLFNFVVFNDLVLFYNLRILQIIFNIIGFICYAYVLWLVAKLLVAAEGHGSDRYRQVGYAFLMYFNIVGAYVIWKKLRFIKNNKMDAINMN